ncbi:MAG: DUF2125 domain-containing protein [Holosporales bacterium]
MAKRSNRKPRFMRYGLVVAGLWAVSYWGLAPLALNHAISQLMQEAESHGIHLQAEQKGIQYFPRVKWSQYHTTITIKNGGVIRVADEMAIYPHPITWFLGDLRWRTHSPVDYRHGSLHVVTSGTHVRMKSQSGKVGDIKLDAHKVDVKLAVAKEGTPEQLLSQLQGLTARFSDQNLMIKSERIVSGESAEGVANVNLSLRAEKRLPSLSTKGLEAWYKADDALEIEELSFNWRDARFALKGTLSLDQDLQPLLSATAQLDHFGSFLKGLVEAQVLSKGMASTIESIALLLPGSKKEAEKTHIHNLPVTIQERVLSLGPVNVAELPMIVWP